MGNDYARQVRDAFAVVGPKSAPTAVSHALLNATV
jgi:hypothetical protein